MDDDTSVWELIRNELNKQLCILAFRRPETGILAFAFTAGTVGDEKKVISSVQVFKTDRCKVIKAI